MVGSRMLAVWVSYLLFFARLISTSTATTVQPADACSEFGDGRFPGSVWTSEDCMDVWTEFNSTIPDELMEREPMVDIWRDMGAELRRDAVPCMLGTDRKSDGVGSSTIRHIAAWVLSREMNCDWVTPDYGRHSLDGGNGTIMYCHKVSTKEETQLFKSPGEASKMKPCEVANWIEYFQFRVPSMDEPDRQKVKVIEVRSRDAEKLEARLIE